MEDNVLIKVDQLQRRYGGNLAVNNLSFEVRRGEVLGFLGPNGAGKSTTMQIIAGTLAPSAGQVRINGLDILDKPVEAKRQIGFLPEQPPLYPELSVNEYLRYAARLRGIGAGDLATALDTARRRCGLQEVSDRLIGNLSKGFQQRVGIAQAIIHSPAVVILDEPTVGLDPNQIREIRDLIRELGGEHSVILSTHILPEVQAVCDRVQIIHQGQLVLNESLEHLRRGASGLALRVAFGNPPADGELMTLPGVQSISTLGDGQWLLDCSNDPRPALLAASIEQGWQLLELTPVQHSLEEIFVRLTTGEERTSLEQVSSILTIAGRELRSLFLSPLAWTILAVVQVILAWLFLVQLETYMQALPQLASLAADQGLGELVAAPLLQTDAFIMLLVVPLVTMRLISEERRSGTLSLLLSSPLPMYAIVLGKYLAVMGFLLVQVALVSLMPLSLLLGGSLDLGILASAVLGLVLLLSAFTAAGLFLSTLTDQPAIAAISGFGMLLLLWILDWAGASAGSGDNQSVLSYLSLVSHLQGPMKGVFDTQDLVYYLLFTLTFLVLAVRRLDAYRLQH